MILQHTLYADGTPNNTAAAKTDLWIMSPRLTSAGPAVRAANPATVRYAYNNMFWVRPSGGDPAIKDVLPVVYETATLNETWWLHAATTLSAPLSTSGAITTLPVAAIRNAIASGKTVTISVTGHTQTWTLSATAAAGATSLTVTSQTPNFAYPSGSLVKGPADSTNRIQNGTNWLLNPGDAGYRTACASWIASAYADGAPPGGWDGLFIDGVELSVVFYPLCNEYDQSIGTIGSWPNAWQSAVVGWLGAVIPTLRSGGIPTFVGNVTFMNSFLNGDGTSFSMQQVIAAGLDGVYNESFTDGGAGYAQNVSVGVTPGSMYDAQWCRQNGHVYVGQTAASTGPTDRERAYRYALGAILMGANPADSTNRVVLGIDENYSEPNSPWYQVFDLAKSLGAPTTNLIANTDGTYSRVFAGGRVDVNPTASVVRGIAAYDASVALASAKVDIRERPPLRLHVGVSSPAGMPAEWLSAGTAQNAPQDLSFSTTMPGGFEQMQCVLSRSPAFDYADLTEFSTLTVFGVGGQPAWQGRLQSSPRASGAQIAITPGAVGWQAHLDDNQTARVIYIDALLSNWGPVSAQRKLDTLGTLDIDDAGVQPDATTGFPALNCVLPGAWTRTHYSEGWYDAKGLALATLYYYWTAGPGVTGGVDANWTFRTALSDDDRVTAFDVSAELRGTGPGSGSLAATTATRKFAVARLGYAGAAGSNGVNYALLWQLAVIGNHGLTVRGTWGQTPGSIGFYASDIVQHAVQTWAPKLAVSRAGVSTIEQTSFVIPQIAFTDPTSVSAIIAEALRYEYLDWWVDEGPTFNTASPANHGSSWRARVGPSGLQETGPQVDRLYNSVVVSYNDISGVARTVGPTGSGASTIDDTLADSDPTNPVNVAGLNRPYEYPNVGTSTAGGASAIGRRFLAEQKQTSTKGQATIAGHVQDAAGVWWPAWAIRSGDWISFTDAHDTSPRRVVKTSYSDSTRTNQLDLDSPPQDLPAMIARMSGAIAALGFK